MWSSPDLDKTKREKLIAPIKGAIKSIADSLPIALIEEMDTFLAAIGTAQDHFPLFWNAGVSEFIGVDYNIISRCLFGDLGGVPITKHTRDGDEKKIQAAITERWTGLHRKDVERCAQAARGEKPKGPWVIAFGVGKYRAAVAYKCIEELGCINELLIDTDLATAFLKGPPFPEYDQ